MKIQAGLLSAALRTVSVSSQGSQISEKPSVYVIASGKKLVCRTTDLGLFTEAIIPTKTSSANDVSVLAVLGPLMTFVGAQDEDAVIDLQLEKSEIRVSSGRDRAKVKTLDKKSFSSWPSRPDFKLMKSVDAFPIVKAMKDVAFAASAALVTPELYNVHLVVNGPKSSAVAEAADGRRYCRMAVPITRTKGMIDELVPLRVVQSLVASEGSKIGVLKNFVCIRFVEERMAVTMWCRTSIGNYPHVEEMLPKKFSVVTRVDGKEFDKRLGVCMAYADDTERDLELTVERGIIRMGARDMSSGAYATRVKTVDKGKGTGSILLDSKHLHDIAQTVDNLIINMNGPKDVFIVLDDDRFGLLYAMWPLTRVEKKEEAKEDAAEE